MMRINLILLAILAISAACSIAQSSSVHADTSTVTSVPIEPVLKGVCKQTLPEVAVSGNFYTFMTSWTLSGDLGRYPLCKMLHDEWCGVHLNFRCFLGNGSMTDLPYVFKAEVSPDAPVLGLCVNSTACTTEALNKELFRVSTTGNYSGFIQLSYGRLGAVVPYLVEQCNYSSFTYLSAHCERDRVKWYDDPPARGFAIFVFMLLGLVAVATIIGRIFDVIPLFRKLLEAEEPSNESQQLVSAPLNEENVEIQSTEKNEMTIPRALLWLKWFDLYYSSKDLITVVSRSVGDVNTDFFEGMRTVAMLFVVYGHTIYFPQMIARFINVTEVMDFIKTYAAIGVYPALLAVDTFFFLSGFLFMHLYMKQCEKLWVKKGGKEREEPIRPLGIKLTLLMYLRRYLRITPLVAVTMFGATFLFKHMPSGPLAPIYEPIFFAPCKDQWWHVILYIQNLKQDWSACVGWFWYLACDMQLFILAPILAATFYFTPYLFYFLMISGILIASSLCGKDNCMFDFQHYSKTWVRAAPYFYGMMGATFVRIAAVKNILRRPAVRLLFYFFGFGLLVMCINMLWEGQSRTSKAYQKATCTLCMLLWGPGWLLINIPWAMKHNGFVATFFSHPIFCVLAKLTFGCYMIHPVIMCVITADAIQFPAFTPLLFYADFGGFALWAFFGAAILYVVVEYPFAQLNNALTKLI